MREPNGFAGLTTEYTLDASPEPKTFAIEDSDDFTVNVGTHVCPGSAGSGPLDPPSGPVDCRSAGAPEIVTAFDLFEAVYGVGSIFGEQTIAERAVLLPEPAFVQVAPFMEGRTTGGNNACGLDGTCAAPTDGSLSYDVATDFGAEYAFDDPAAPNSRQSRDMPNGEWFGDEDFAGANDWDHMRRPIDGLSYAGDPGNDSVDTLIPWSVFVANHELTLTMTGHDVYDLKRSRCGALVRPWYPVDPPTEATGQVYIMDAA